MCLPLIHYDLEGRVPPLTGPVPTLKCPVPPLKGPVPILKSRVPPLKGPEVDGSPSTVDDF
jgi:hypothetical protein